MPDRINLLTSLGNNTGKTNGDIRPGRIKWFLLTRGKVFSASELADSDTVKAAIIAAMQLPRTSINKLFLFEGFREVDDNTGDPNTGTLADGYEEVLNDAIPKYVLRNTKGLAQQQSLAAFTGWQDGMFVVDDKNVLYYLGTATGGGAGLPVGFFYADKPRFGSSSNIVTNQVRFSFASADVFGGAIGATKLNFSPTDLPNIVDVQLKAVGAQSATVLKVGAETKFAGTDIYEAYADALNVAGAWKVTKLSDGSNVAVSAVAKDAANKAWNLTTASSAGLHRVELADPAALAALTTPVTGIEGIYVNITR